MESEAKNRPPKFARTFLRWYCKPDLLEEIEGDLTEEFNRRSISNRISARSMYFFQVLSFFRPFATKKLNFMAFFPNSAITWHYLKVALRAFRRQKLSSAINVLSLSFGIGIAVLIYLFIQNEWSFDAFHENKDRIYRINRLTLDTEDQRVEGIEGHPAPFINAAKDLVPDIEAITGMFDDEEYIKTKRLTSEATYFAVHPDFFKIFDFQSLYGDLNSALNNINDVVVTESMAMKHFGYTNVIGEILEIHFSAGYKPFRVSAVLNDPSPNSSFQYDLIIPFEYLDNTNIGQRYGNTWNISFIRTFAMLHEGASPVAVENKLKSLADQHFTRRDHIYEMYGDGSYYGYQLQPLTDMHFDRDIPSDLHEPGDENSAYVLAGIGLIILLIGCINFAILAIGRSSNRVHEIGLRKVVGARKGQLVHQFLGESFFLSFLSLGIGLGLASISLQEFGNLAGRALSFHGLLNPLALCFLIALTIFAGWLAGIYPALYLSGFKPVVSLTDRIKFGKGSTFTSFMIVIQFVLCTTLVILTFTMTKQLNYLKSRDLGFKEEQLIVIQRNGADKGQFFSVYRNEMKGNPDIIDVSATAPAFTHGSYRSEFKYEGKDVPYQIYFVESNYKEVMGMELASGRFFDHGLAQDSTEHIVVNEAFVRALNWSDPIGRKVTGLSNAGYDEPLIIGVLKDFNYRSLEYEIQPVWMALAGESTMDDLIVRIRPDNMGQTLATLEELWASINPEIPFTYSFMDEDMAALYASHERWSKVVKRSGYLSLAIAYIGMFGLIALNLAGRLKEISIRKILGAGIKDIAFVLSARLAVLLLVSIIFAIPLAWYFSEQWLQNFAFRIAVKPETFVLASLLLSLIFAITISFHLVQSIRLNPVDNLRS